PGKTAKLKVRLERETEDQRFQKSITLEAKGDTLNYRFTIPIQKGIEHPYAIEVQTGYNLNCSGILQKLERFRKALTKPGLHIGWGDIEETAVRKTIYPKLFVIIPPDFAEFLPLFKPKKISVFLWEGTLEWECKKCREVTLSSGPWKPVTCDSSSCKGKKRSFSLVGLADFSIREPD
ncbi:MAG: hypothetical protein ACFFB3_23045, partial [Candidatus Hodarchaeota archaeon]